MRWIGLLIGLGLFTGVTGFAFLGSAQGWGLPGMLDKPVSIRQQSVRRRHGGGPVFLYFGSRRRHYGGGYGFGK